MTNINRPTCPHCNSRLLKWLPPEQTNWGESVMFVCFNDECSYFVRGWDWMMSKYQVKASYRYRLDPRTGESGPLAVWSPSALRERIFTPISEDDLREGNGQP